MPRIVDREAFKCEAHRLAQERGNIAQNACDSGVANNTLQRWKSQLDKVPDNPIYHDRTGRGQKSSSDFIFGFRSVSSGVVVDG